MCDLMSRAFSKHIPIAHKSFMPRAGLQRKLATSAQQPSTLGKWIGQERLAVFGLAVSTESATVGDSRVKNRYFKWNPGTWNPTNAQRVFSSGRLAITTLLRPAALKSFSDASLSSPSKACTTGGNATVMKLDDPFSWQGRAGRPRLNRTNSEVNIVHAATLGKAAIWGSAPRVA